MVTFFIAMATLVILGGLVGLLFLREDFGAFGVIWGMWAGFCLTITGGAVFVAIHFISLYWNGAP